MEARVCWLDLFTGMMKCVGIILTCIDTRVVSATSPRLFGKLPPSLASANTLEEAEGGPVHILQLATKMLGT